MAAACWRKARARLFDQKHTAEPGFGCDRWATDERSVRVKARD